MRHFASGSHGNPLLGIGKNLADHRPVEPSPLEFRDRVRREYEI